MKTFCKIAASVAAWVLALALLAGCSAWCNGVARRTERRTPVSDDMPSGAPCGAAYPPRPTPWYYWWLPYHGRGQHYAYLPPIPGWYYFRPYSLEQLQAQQRAVSGWGGDPRNPYSNREFQHVYLRLEGRPASGYW